MADYVNVKEWCPVLNPFDNFCYKIIEKYGNGDFENLSCMKLYSKARTPCVRSEGNKDKNIVIIGQNPGEKEDETDRPFVGPSGKKLEEILKDLGYKREDFYITNAVKCYGETDEITQSMIKICSISILRREINLIKPNMIICLGRIAFLGVQYALLGKIKEEFERGKIIEIESPILGEKKKVKVCMTYHPSYILRNPNYEPEFKKDLSTFLKEGDITIEYEILDTYEKVKDFVDSIVNSKGEVYAVVDLETFSKDVHDPNNKIFCIGIALSEKKAFIIPLRHYEALKRQIVNFFIEGIQEKVIEELRRLFSYEKLKIIGHNFKFDALVLLRDLEVDVMDKVYADTLVYHHLLKETPPHDLKTLITLYTPFSNYYKEMKEVFVSKKEKWYHYVDFNDLYKYCAYDCCSNYYLWKELDRRIKQLDLWQKSLSSKVNKLIEEHKKLDKPYITPYYTYFQVEKLKELEMEHYRILFEMEKNGLPFSRSYVENLKEEIQYKMKEKQNELSKLAGKMINWNSSQQISKLFKELRIDSPKKTPKGNPSYDEEALKILAENGVEIAQKLLEYRKLLKNYTTYVLFLENYNYRLKQTETEDIVRLSCSINIAGTETGRLSTSNPAFHGIPRDNLYRNMIQAEEGWLIVSADYSMADLRMLAGYSNCKSMIEAFNSGIDFHTLTASLIFNKNLEDITIEERSIAKSINFSIAYLTSAYGLAQRLNISVKEAQDFIDRWFQDKPEVKYFINVLISQYDKTEEGKEAKFMNIFGRMRRVQRVRKYYEDKLTRKRKLNPEYSHRIREIVNFYPQSTVADALMISLIRLKRKLIEKELKPFCKFLLTRHDELLLEAKKEKADEICEVVKWAMEFPIPFANCQIVIPVDFTIDKMWKKE